MKGKTNCGKPYLYAWGLFVLHFTQKHTTSVYIPRHKKYMQNALCLVVRTLEHRKKEQKR
jgi:hypothetical protein